MEHDGTQITISNIYLKYISVSRRISFSITHRICHHHCEPNWYGSEKQTEFDCINNYTQHIAKLT